MREVAPVDELERLLAQVGVSLRQLAFGLQPLELILARNLLSSLVNWLNKP